MRHFPSDIAFTESVKKIQADKGSRTSYSKVEQHQGWKTRVTQELRAFVSGLDMFYLGTANSEGQPYVQYRGGPAGFLKVLDDQTLAFADFGGNRQYITLGNLAENPNAFLFLMDYATSSRVKVWGTATVSENDPELLARLSDQSYPGKVERAIVFTIGAWDINCPQHIHKRFAQSEIIPVLAELKAKIATLEEQLRVAREGDGKFDRT